MVVTTSRKTLPSDDVIVVGSGAGGGRSADVLTKGGLKVLTLGLDGPCDYQDIEPWHDKTEGLAEDPAPPPEVLKHPGLA